MLRGEDCRWVEIKLKPVLLVPAPAEAASAGVSKRLCEVRRRKFRAQPGSFLAQLHKRPSPAFNGDCCRGY
jgi:hypothetical protein